MQVLRKHEIGDIVYVESDDSSWDGAGWGIIQDVDREGAPTYHVVGIPGAFEWVDILSGCCLESVWANWLDIDESDDRDPEREYIRGQLKKLEEIKLKYPKGTVVKVNAETPDYFNALAPHKYPSSSYIELLLPDGALHSNFEGLAYVYYISEGILNRFWYVIPVEDSIRILKVRESGIHMTKGGLK